MKDFAKAGICLLLIVFAAVCLVVAPAAAEQGAASFTGKVKDVDLQERSVVAGSPDGDVVVYIEKESRITSGGEAKPLADITVGMVVKVVYTVAGEDKIVESVDILQ